MPITIKNTDLAYFPIPKIGTTSFKKFIYQVNNGSEFESDNSSSERANRMIHNHDPEFRVIPFSEVDWSRIEGQSGVVLVRDPIERILSSFSNRVLSKNALSAEKIDPELPKIFDIPIVPSLAEFIRNLEKYRVLSPDIRHHTHPQTYYLGPDMQAYQHVFPLGRIQECADFVNGSVGTTYELPHSQKSEAKFRVEDLSPKDLAVLLDLCSGDYAALKDWFTPPSLSAHGKLRTMRKKLDHRIDTKVDKGSDKPVIIWTLQRSGGTHLSDFLFRHSSRDSIEHEPLSLGRKLGYISEHWQKTGCKATLRAQLRNELSNLANIKHCVETVPPPVNQALAEISCEKGYQHLFLIRRTPHGRLLSLHFSKLLDIWSPAAQDAKKTEEIVACLKETDLPVEELLTHEKRCRFELNRSLMKLQSMGSVPAISVFEDIYNRRDHKVAVELLSRIASYLGVSSDINTAALNDVITTGEQGSRKLYDRFRNYSAFIKATEALGNFSIGSPVPQVPEAALSVSDRVFSKLFGFTRSWRSDLLKLNGVGLDPANPQGNWVVMCGGQEIKTYNGLPSEGFKAANPELAGADRARFTAIDIPESALNDFKVVFR